MKKFISIMVAAACAAACASFTACDDDEDETQKYTVAEETDSDVVTEEQWQSAFSVDNFNNFTVSVTSERQTSSGSGGVSTSSSSLVRTGESKYDFAYDADAYFEYYHNSYLIATYEGALTGNYYNKCSMQSSSSSEGAETYTQSYVYMQYGVYGEDDYTMAEKTDNDGEDGTWSTSSAGVPYPYTNYSGSFCGIAGAYIPENGSYVMLATSVSNYSPSSEVYFSLGDMFGEFVYEDGAYVYGCAGNGDADNDEMWDATSVTEMQDDNTFTIKIIDGKCVSIKIEYCFYIETDASYSYTESRVTEYVFSDYGTTVVDFPDEVSSLF